MAAMEGDSPPPTGGEPFEIVDAPTPDFEKEELEHLYSLFDPDNYADQLPEGTKPKWEDKGVKQHIEERRRSMGGALIFDRLLELAGIEASEHYPPTTVPALHALLDQINSSENWDKAKKDCLVFYLLLWAFHPPSWPGAGRRRGQGPASRFARAEALPTTFVNSTTAYYLLDQGYYVQALGFLSTASENQVDFKSDILATLRNIPIDYKDPTGESWELGAYRARAFASFVDSLGWDTVGAWRSALTKWLSATRSDGRLDEADEQEHDLVELKAILDEAEDHLVAYAESSAFERGVWMTWEGLVESLPSLLEGILQDLELMLEVQEDLKVADAAHEAISSLREKLARVIWNFCFFPKPRPKAVKDLLAMPLPSESSDLLSKIVLKPSPSLPAHLQAAAADVLLVRFVDEGRYVDALRLDAQLEARSIKTAGNHIENDSRRSVLLEKRKRLMHGVRALLPAVQKKLLDVELGFVKEAGSEEIQETVANEGAQRTDQLQMSWENVKRPDSATNKAAPASPAAQPLSASVLLRQSPHNVSDPQMAVLSAVVRSPLSPSSSPKPSEVVKRQRQRPSDAPSPLDGFLSRNRRTASPLSPYTPSKTKPSPRSLTAGSPFVGPPNLPTGMLGGEPIVEDESDRSTFREDVSNLSNPLLQPPVRKYQARYTDPAASETPRSTPGFNRRSQSPATFVQSPALRQPFAGPTFSPGGATDDSNMEDEIMPIATRASRTQLGQMVQTDRAVAREAKTLPDSSTPVRRRFGSPARSTRTSTRTTRAEVGAGSSLRKEVRQDDDDVANKTVPGSFPGIADDAERDLGNDVNDDDMEVDAGETEKAKASSGKKTSKPRVKAGATPRKKATRRQKSVDVESQLGSEEDEDDNAPPNESLQAEAPVTSTPAKRTRSSKTTRRAAKGKSDEQAELESVSEATQTEEDEDEAGDTVGELSQSTRRSSRLRKKDSGSMPTRRSSRLSATSEEPEGAPEQPEPEEVDKQKPKRRAAARSRKAAA